MRWYDPLPFLVLEFLVALLVIVGIWVFIHWGDADLIGMGGKGAADSVGGLP